MILKTELYQKKSDSHAKILTEGPMTQPWPRHAQPLSLAQSWCHADSTRRDPFSLEESPFSPSPATICDGSLWAAA